jgi:hypothetical protein
MTDATELFPITGATGKTKAPAVGLLRERVFRVRSFVEAIGGTPPMTVEQYTTVTRDSFASDGQQTMCEGGGMANATIIERL